MGFAPVMIYTLNRISHLEKAINSLAKCHLADQTDIYIGLDFPPSEEYREGYERIVEYLEILDQSSFKSFNIVRRCENYGAVKNCRSLREHLMSIFERVIVMEDDIEVSPNFLLFMNTALDYYENDSSVIAVCGYSYPIQWEHDAGANSIKANYIASTWGIGFWSSKYRCIDSLIRNNYMFDSFIEAYKSGKMKQMADACVIDYCRNFTAYIKQGKAVDESSFFLRATDVSLRAFIGISDKYVVLPTLSHTRNNGFDGSGVVCGKITKHSEGQEYADNYDYDSQQVDDSESYAFTPSKNDYIEENLLRYNSFDRRNVSEVKRAIEEADVCIKMGPVLFRFVYITKCHVCALMRRMRKLLRI